MDISKKIESCDNDIKHVNEYINKLQSKQEKCDEISRDIYRGLLQVETSRLELLNEKMDRLQAIARRIDKRVEQTQHFESNRSYGGRKLVG